MAGGDGDNSLSARFDMALNPTLIFTAPPRITGATGHHSPPRGYRALPINEYSQLVLGFDFGLALAPGITLKTASVNCVVFYGVDASANLRVLGAPEIDASTITRTADAEVDVLIGNMIGNVVYQLQCNVTTSDGQNFMFLGNISCQPVIIAVGQPLVDENGNPIVDQNDNPLVS